MVVRHAHCEGRPSRMLPEPRHLVVEVAPVRCGVGCSASSASTGDQRLGLLFGSRLWCRVGAGSGSESSMVPSPGAPSGAGGGAVTASCAALDLDGGPDLRTDPRSRFQMTTVRALSDDRRSRARGGSRGGGSAAGFTTFRRRQRRTRRRPIGQANLVVRENGGGRLLRTSRRCPLALSSSSPSVAS